MQSYYIWECGRRQEGMLTLGLGLELELGLGLGLEVELGLWLGRAAVWSSVRGAVNVDGCVQKGCHGP